MAIILKRDGSVSTLNPNKILSRIKKAAKGLKVNSDEIFIKTITSLPSEDGSKISTIQIDELIAQICASYTGSHIDYAKLGATIGVSSHHKQTTNNFYKTMQTLNLQGIVNDKLIKIIEEYGIEEVNKICIYEQDYNFDYFAWRSLVEMYLLKDETGLVIERPQHMFLRVSLWITDSLKEAKEYYQSLSQQTISKASPMMINAGTKVSQLASCVLHYNDGDSREGLLKTIHDVSTYSADAAGIGLCLSNLRSKESKIKSSGGNAGGLLKYCKIINESLRFFNQQGKRPGSAAIYIEPWHKDILDFLEIKKQTGKDELRARDIFTALWVPDNFMKAVKEDGDWYLFCPNDIKNVGIKPLQECYGEEYETNYNKAVELGIGTKIKAQEVWKKIYESQIETGVPYLLAKDTVNKSSNHQNLGVVKSSNLCAEIVQFTDEKTTAICTLSSLVLKNFIIKGKFDFDLLNKETRKIVKALNKVIDINHYSTSKGERGGKDQRSLAIGVQGLADVFFILDLTFTSPEARLLNKQIMETIYFASITESNELCKSGKYKPYKGFKGSPLSHGTFHFDFSNNVVLSGMWDFETLRSSVMTHGVCNSMFVGIMPTASSAKITGSFEMTEPAHSGLFSRRVIGGEILISNRYLIKDLEDIGLWSETIKNELIVGDGSLINITFNKYLNSSDKDYDKKVERLTYLIEKYKTIWEIKQKDLIDMAADRAPFIDQSQSMNIYMNDPSLPKLTSCHFYSWEKGLKTLCYYLRTKSISTGAKHLAIDMADHNTFNVTPIHIEQLPIHIEQLPIHIEQLPQKPKNSQFECFGCSA